MRTPEWFQRLNQSLKLIARKHEIPFPYNGTLETRVMTVIKALEERK